MTYREFAMICEENIERTHDEHEREAMYAIMYAAASRGKGKQGKLPKVEDLYKRPNGDEELPRKQSPEEIIERNAQAIEWLSQFDLSNLTDK